MILNEKMASLWMVLIYSIILWSAQFVTVSTESPCQGMAHLGGSYDISAKIVYSNFAWIRPHDNQNVATCSPQCSGSTTYTATQKNAQNVTTLTIGRIQFRDAGTWAISDTSSGSVPACHLTVAGLPSCIIISSLPHDSLEPNSELTLVAEIRGYYCSKQAGFELTTGSYVPEVLLKNNTVTGVTDIVLHSTFRITLKRLGNVQLDFTCADTTFHLSCRGVTKLLKTKTTTVLVPTSMQTTLTGSSVSDPKAEGRLSSSTDIFSTTPSETTPSSSSSPTSLIVAVAASAAIIIAVVVVILCVRRYRRTRPRKDHQHSNIYATPSAYEDMNNPYCELRTNHGLTEGESTPSSYANSTHHKKEEAIFTNSQDEATLSCYVNTV